MQSDTVLKMHQIRKTFPGVVALDGVEFELKRGEVHVLLGENGAGKSTLMKILSGAYQKSSGEIFLNGRNVSIRSPKHARALGIATIYQEYNLIPHLSVAENIFLGREPTVLPGVIDQKTIVRQAQRVLRELGVNVGINRRVHDLGVAQQQMVEIAKAISQRAQIFIMDEPTAALTDLEIEGLFSTVRKLKRQGVSIVYISHRIEELFEIGDRVTVLRDGQYIGTRDTQTVSKSELITMMVNREITELFPKQKAVVSKEVLRVEDLNKKGALYHISFSLFQGEILGIAGLLGSGRTELARAIFGVDPIDSGTIWIKNSEARLCSPRIAINAGMGFLTEDRRSQGLIGVLSVQENICLTSLGQFSRFGIVRPKEAYAAANQFVKELRIKTPSLYQKVMYLSGGNQQKVVLSKWLCSQAEIFIFDEPTLGIDVGAKVEIYKLMNDLTAAGTAIVMISSELPEILGMSDRILVMNEGRISGELTAAEATQEKILHYALERH
ncbi:MAG: sugar ABC transporter ATP-binding protein [bacterium]